MRIFKESIGTVLDIDTLLDMLNGDTISDVADAITNRSGPRACGDDPKIMITISANVEWTPRMRG